jgi:hypothetical protein
MHMPIMEASRMMKAMRPAAVPNSVMGSSTACTSALAGGAPGSCADIRPTRIAASMSTTNGAAGGRDANHHNDDADGEHDERPVRDRSTGDLSSVHESNLPDACGERYPGSALRVAE